MFPPNRWFRLPVADSGIEVQGSETRRIARYCQGLTFSCQHGPWRAKMSRQLWVSQ